MTDSADAQKVTIITVHGTGDTAAGPDGEKWFQNGSAFAGRLKERLATRGVDAEIVPHLWSGANSARGREAGANALAERLRKLRKTHDAIHLIGHSHGGNVANDAAVAIGWKGDACKSKVKSVTTVGTPFIRSQVGFAEWLASWVFLVMAVISMLALAATFVGVALHAFSERRTPNEPFPLHVYERMERDDANRRGETVTDAEIMRRAVDTQKIEEFAYSEMLATQDEGNVAFGLTLAFGVLLALGAAFLVFRIALTGCRRVSRIRKPQRGDASVVSLWHPNDEAIAFLARVETAPLTAFARGALWRGSQQVGVNLGVQAVIVALLALIACALLGAIGVENLMGWKPHPQYWGAIDPETGARPLLVNGILYLSLVLLALSPFLLPFVYGIAWVVGRLIAGVVPELLMRGWYNDVVLNALKGIAFGRDGDARIGQVSARSHYFATQEHVLEGEVAARMQVNSQGAASALIEKYRWSLFSVGGGDDTAIDALATDAMTWDSLIHTTYFDQPEVADMIADTIAASHSGAPA